MTTIIEISYQNYTENVIVTEANLNEVIELTSTNQWAYIQEGTVKVPTIETTLEGVEVYRVGNRVKLVNMDTFGEVYRNNWLKVSNTDKGEFFVSSYMGGMRVYLNNSEYMG